MPIDASPSGTLDIENATLRSREIVALTNMVAGNDVVRSDGPALEVYGDPGPRLELVSNTAATDGTATFTRLESNVGVFSIQSGTDASTNGPITFGGFANERMRIDADGNVGIGTTNPKTPLEVSQSDGYFNSMYIQKYLGAGPELATSYVLLLKSESSNPKRFSGKISGVRGYSSVNNAFEAEIIAGVGSAAALSGRMTFTFSGNSNNFYAKLVSLTYNSSTYIALALIPTANYNGMSGGIYFNGKTNAIDELQYITDLTTLSNIVDFPVSAGDKTTFTGNVGIGVTNPGARLDVGGGINISGGRFCSEGYNVADNLGLLLEGGNPASTLGENGTCGIGFNTRSRKAHIKGAILATPQSWGRSDIHICTNNLVGSGSTEENYKVSVADARLTVLSTGNVGIGTTNPVAKLTLNAYGNPGSTNCLIIGTNIASQNLRIGVDSTNEFCWIQSHAGKPLRLNPDGNQVQYGTSDTVLSDDRIKVNEVYIENATDTLLKLKPQIYDKKLIWNISKLGETSNTSIVREGGLITQDVWYDTPELRHLVHLGEGAEPGDDKPYTDNDPTNDPDYSSWGDNVSLLDYNGLIPYLIKSNQELHARIQALENAS